MSERPQDYAIPLHRALLPRILVLGVSKMAAIAIFLIADIIGLGFRQWWFFAVGIIAFLVMRFITKRDEYFAEILLYASKAPDKLYP